MPFSASIPIEMQAAVIYADSSLSQKYLCTEVSIDPSNYDGVANAWFEGVVQGSTGTNVYLVNETDTVLATLTKTSAYNERLRSAFTLDAGTMKYYVKMPVGSSDPYLRTARIILDVEDATKVRVPISLIGGDESTGGGNHNQALNDFYPYCVSRYQGTYGYGSLTSTAGEYFRLFYLDKSKWATVSKWELEVIGTGYDDYNEHNVSVSFGLFNKDTDTMVSGAEVSTTGGKAPERMVVEIDGDDLTDLNSYEIRLKGGGATNDYAYIYRAILWVTLNPATKAEIHWKVGTVLKGGLGGSGYVNPDSVEPYDTMARIYWEPTKYGTIGNAYLESTAVETGGGAHLYLQDAGTSDAGFKIYSQICSSYSASANWTTASNVTAWDSACAFLPVGAFPDTIAGRVFNLNVDSDPPVLWVVARMIAGSAYDSYGTIDGRMSVGGFADHSWNLVAAVPLTGVVSNVTADASWSAATLNADPEVLISIDSYTGGMTFFRIDAIWLEAALGINIANSELNFSAATRERQRSADVKGDLEDGRRYFLYFYTYASNTLKKHSETFLILEAEGGTGDGDGNGDEYNPCRYCVTKTPVSVTCLTKTLVEVACVQRVMTECASISRVC